MQIRDDRGSLVHASNLAPFHEMLTPDDRIQDIESDMRTKSSRVGVRSETAILLLVSVTLMTLGIFILKLSLNTGLVSIALIVGGLLVLCYAITHPWRMKRQVKRLQRELDRIGDERDRCQCCRYKLQGLEPEPDGCTVCPECGGAWKVER